MTGYLVRDKEMLWQTGQTEKMFCKNLPKRFEILKIVHSVFNLVIPLSKMSPKEATDNTNKYLVTNLSVLLFFLNFLSFLFIHKLK